MAVQQVRAGAVTMRWTWRLLGGHVHVSVRSGAPKPDGFFPKNGDLIFGEDEWPVIASLLSPRVELVEAAP